MKTIKNKIWRWNIQRKFDYIYNIYLDNLNVFHDIERDSVRSIKNSFDFYFNRSSWERNKDKIEKYIEQLNIKVNHRIKNTKC